MKIGAHVSAAGGVWNAPVNAKELGLETFQIFSRSPRGGPAPKVGKAEVAKFEAAMTDNGFSDFVIHAPYYTNLGSDNKKIYHGTISVLREELERGHLLGASFLMFHPGSFKIVGQEQGMKQVVEGIGLALEGYSGNTKLLVEISAGAGSICGDSFLELGEILRGNEKYLGKTLGGICFDTQHAFASGYDLRTAETVKKVFEGFEKEVGLENLKMIHANDSKVDLGGRRDRHEHIADGFIGKKGFEVLASELKRRTLNNNMLWILETKHDKIVEDIEILKKIKMQI